MNWFKTMMMGATGAAVFHAGLKAAEVWPTNNPYATIAAQNVFRLQPLPPVAPAPSNAPPLPKITLNGIMTILGPREALFKVTEPPSPQHPDGIQNCLLKEDEQQAGITVRQVDEKAGVVYFDNNGTLQAIKLGAKDSPEAMPMGAVHHPF